MVVILETKYGNYRVYDSVVPPKGTVIDVPEAIQEYPYKELRVRVLGDPRWEVKDLGHDRARFVVSIVCEVL